MQISYIIITGPPASGKSTLAQRLSKRYELPLIQLDVVQESLFDTMDTADNAAIATTSYKIIFNQAEEHIKHSQPFIIESNFNPKDHTAFFEHIELEYGVTAIQIVCEADRSVLVNRFEARWNAGTRHPKHHDDKHFKDLRTARLVELQPMALLGPVFRFDTSDIASIDYNGLTSLIETHLTIGK